MASAELFITINNNNVLHPDLKSLILEQDEYLIGQEIGKVEKHLHYHIYCKSNKFKYKQYYDKFRLLIIKHYSGKHNEYRIEKPKNYLKVVAYSNKDGDVEHNLSEQRIEEIVLYTKKVKESQSTPMKDKLLKHFIESNETSDPSPHQIIKSILTFYKAIKWLPPNKSQMYQYTTYIMLQLYSDIEDVIIQQKLI